MILFFILSLYFIKSSCYLSFESDNELRQYLFNSSKVSVVFTYNSNDCNLLCTNILNEIKNETNYIYELTNLIINDCKSQLYLTICEKKELNISELPELSLYEPFNGKKHNYKISEFSIEILQLVLQKLTPIKSKEIYSKNELLNFLEERTEIEKNKVLFFYNTSEINYKFKVLSCVFFQKLEFAQIHSNSQEIIKFYSIKEYPSLLILKRNSQNPKEFFKFEYKPPYQSDNQTLNYTHLHKFLSKYELKQHVYYHAPPNSNEIDLYLVKFNDLESEWSQTVVKNINISLGKEQFNPEKINFIHFVNDTKTFLQYNEIISKFSNLLDYYQLNCSGKNGQLRLNYAKKIFKITKFPSIVLYTNDYNLSYWGSIGMNEITESISNIIMDDSISTQSENELELHISTAFLESKLVFLVFYNTLNCSMSFRGLSNLNKFKEYVKFIKFKNASEAIRYRYGVSSENQILAIIPRHSIKQSGGNIVISYKKKWIYHEIAKFLHFVLIKYLGDIILKLVREINNPDNFKQFCEYENNAICFFGLLQKNSIKKQISILENLKVKGNHPEFPLFWIDGECQTEIMKEIGLNNENLPLLLVYFLNENSYVLYKKNFSEDKMFNFISQLENKKRRKLRIGLKYLFIKDCDNTKTKKKNEEIKINQNIKEDL